MVTNTATEMERRRADLADKMRAYHAQHSATWNDADEKEWQRLSSEYDRLKNMRDNERELGQSTNHLGIGRHDVPPSHSEDGDMFNRRRDFADESPFGRHLMNAATGQLVPVLGPGERFTDSVSVSDAERNCSLDMLIQGVVTGNWAGPAREIRNLAGYDGPAGGFAVPMGMSARIIDKLRNKSSVMALGPSMVNMDTRELTLLKVTGSPTAYWVGERGAITTSEPTFGALVLRSMTIGVLMSASLELLEDAKDVGETIENEAAQALALELDRAALRGSAAASEPTGIRYTDGVNSTAVSGAMSYDDLLGMLTRIQTDNGEPNGWIVSARTAGSIRELKDGEGKYLVPHPDIAKLTQRVSNQIPTNLGAGENETEVYMGDFRQILVGTRKRVTIEVFKQGKVGDDDAISQRLAWFRVWARGDIAIAHPELFEVLTGTTS